MAEPNPQPLYELLTLEGVDEYKRYGCRMYTKCLDVAAIWPQFHCNDCDAYVPIDPEAPSHVKFLLRQRMKNGVNE